MTRLVIDGGQPLRGRVRISGRKNSAVAVLPAALLAPSPSRLENIPNISDVATFRQILQELNVGVEVQGSTWTVDPSRLDPRRVDFELTRRLRASYYLLGALLARTGHAEVALPGGCDLGPRPIDQHLKGFRALGADVQIERGIVTATARKLQGARVYFDIVSVGATINLMLAAVLAEGTTVLENAAKEPHVVDLANYLNACGARVRGAGTDVIKIHGVPELHGAEHAIIPDEIEAATFMTATAGTGGDVWIENVIPKHLEPISAKLREAGAEVWENGDVVRVTGSGRLQPVNLKTMPYPGFPTDAMPLATSMLAVAQGTSVITEGIWDNRFTHVDELRKMGACVRVNGRTAVIEGVERLQGAPVEARDLRGAAALVVAATIAEGRSEVYGLDYLDRGYENTVEKLRGLDVRVLRE